MTEFEQRQLLDALERLESVRDAIGGLHAGVAAFHLDATIAALESHLRRSALKAA